MYTEEIFTRLRSPQINTKMEQKVYVDLQIQQHSNIAKWVIFKQRTHISSPSEPRLIENAPYLLRNNMGLF